MFSMFVESPPPSTPVNLVYFEKLSFGPFGEAAGEPDREAGFSEALWLHVQRDALEAYRKFLVICTGTVRVVGPEPGFTRGDLTAPHMVELVPAPAVMTELDRLCRAARIETPRKFIYHGVDLNSLTMILDSYFTRVSTLRVLAANATRIVPLDPVFIIGAFVNGEVTVPIVEVGLGTGTPMAMVSDKVVENGRLPFGLEIQTTPPLAPSMPEPASKNYLDPVTLFSVLANGKLSDGTDAVNPAQKQNSFLDNVRRQRVLITFRDEWNAALLSPSHDGIVEGRGPGERVAKRLDRPQAGTIEVPAHWVDYRCSVGTPNQRRLTPVPSDEGSADPLIIDADGPSHRVVATVRPEDWFHPADPPYNQPGFDLNLYTQGNIVTPLIDGLPAFARLVADLRELDDPNPSSRDLPDNFAVFAGWYLDPDFELIPGDPTSTLRALLTKGVHSTHKLIVRGLVWFVNDQGAIGMINSLDPERHRTEAAAASFFLNDKIAFHWKSTIVRNRSGTFASLGGIDLHRNRLDDSDHRPGGKAYHDVHCRIQGPAVADVFDAFRARWGIHGLWSEGDDFEPTVTTPAGVPATQMVQIARTFRSGTGGGFQPWSPNGERSIWATLRRAIQRAKRYIYIEDQYLVAAMLRDELAAVLNRPDSNVHIVVVIPDEAHDVMWLANASDYHRARYIFLNNLVGNPRFRVLSIKDYFVHSKVTIIDDIFATIGSANMNRRGLTHDAELNAFVLDARVEGGTRKFARDLRTRLWAEHLGMPLTPASYATLNDIDRAVDIIMNRRPPTSRLIQYALRELGTSYPLGWDSVVDPSGI